MNRPTTTALGREFEDAVEELLRSAGFEVFRNPGAASPRQSDLFARKNNIDLLVEAKNQKRKIDVSNIDDLRSRLNRMSPEVIGIIFTTSDLTKPAIQEIEMDRRREIVVVIKEELERIRQGRQNLATLIDRKRDQLRIQGKVWFCLASFSEFLNVQFPHPTVIFRLAGKDQTLIQFRSTLSGAFYSLEIPDPGWGLLCGEGARISFRLSIYSARDLRDTFGYLQSKFGLSRNGMFVIQQRETCWQGVGIETFLQAVELWRFRYEENTSITYHNSETCRYFDRFSGGWMELSVQQVVSDRSFFMHSDLVMQLPGIPVDTASILNLSEYVCDRGAYFEHVMDRLTHRVRLKTPLDLTTIGLVLDSDPFSDKRLVIGVIARNPFYPGLKLPDEMQSENFSLLPDLHETELLICSLRDWYEDGLTVDKYVLQGFEMTIAGDGRVIRPFGTWNRIKRA